MATGFAAGPGIQEHHSPHLVGPPPFGDRPHYALPGGCLQRVGLGDCDSGDLIIGDRVDAAIPGVEQRRAEVLAALLHAPGREHPGPAQDTACLLAGPGLADAPLDKLVCTGLCEFNLVT